MANESPVATPRRAMFATAKTTSFATGVAVRAPRSTRARRERCVPRRRDRPRVTRRDARSRANDARRARGESRSYLERRGTTTRRATTRDADVRGTNEGRETRSRTRARDASGTRRERRRGFGKGAETRARGAIGTDSERGARARRRDEGLTARAVVRERCSAMKTNAKYGDESVYFDLSDVEATTGSWDVYGVDASSRYPDQQAAFFEYAAQGLGRREAVYSLLAVSAGLLTVGYGVKGAKDAKLPITVGPQQPAVVGPRDRI